MYSIFFAALTARQASLYHLKYNAAQKCKARTLNILSVLCSSLTSWLGTLR